MPKSSVKNNLYQQIYQDYKNKIYHLQEDYYDWYRQVPNLKKAIKKAFKSEDQNNKVHGHQYRVGRKVLGLATEKAIEIYEIKQLTEDNFKDFESVYKFVGLVRRETPRFGELAHYDISVRIAKYLEAKHPKCGDLDQVYLHSGTLEGAMAIFVNGDLEKNIQSSDLRVGEKIDVAAFPSPLNRMPGDHLENWLCIYKDHIRGNKQLSQKTQNCLRKAHVFGACY